MPGVNGNYAPHQGYGSIESQQPQNNGTYSSQSYNQAPPATSTSAPSTNSQAPDIPKDEVGWYFVEQYYTTLSRSPEKLYLFYSKRSQFVSGQETDKVDVCVGQRAINDKIKELDFQDCKVRVTNVDSQASDAHIVIQVIGEISNKSQPHKKFTQTFVLADQVNGYFVLNDIFRYIVDEEDEPEQEVVPQVEEVQQVPAAESGYQEPAPTVGEAEESKTLTSSADPVAVEHDAQVVDKELEEKVLKAPAEPEEETPATVNGVSAQEHVNIEPEDSASAAAEAPTPEAEAPEAVPTSIAEEVTAPEKPQDPEPTPVASPPKQAAVQPAAPPKPAVPKTWASLAASANRVATPTAPSTSGPQPAVPQTRPAPPSAKSSTAAVSTSSAPSAPSAPSAAAAPAAPVAPAAQRDESPATNQQDEWTAVGSSHTRQQSRQVNTQQQEGPQHRGYIKNVHEGVDDSELKARLETFGELLYFDIARQKVSVAVDLLPDSAMLI